MWEMLLVLQVRVECAAFRSEQTRALYREDGDSDGFHDVSAEVEEGGEFAGMTQGLSTC